MDHAVWPPRSAPSRSMRTSRKPMPRAPGADAQGDYDAALTESRDGRAARPGVVGCESRSCTPLLPSAPVRGAIRFFEKGLPCASPTGVVRHAGQLLYAGRVTSRTHAGLRNCARLRREDRSRQPDWNRDGAAVGALAVLGARAREGLG
jgi:hypothetical protein